MTAIWARVRSLMRRRGDRRTDRRRGVHTTFATFHPPRQMFLERDRPEPEGKP